MSEDIATEVVDLDLDAERPSTFRMRGEVYAIRRVSPRRYAEELRKLDAVEKADDSTLEDIWDAQLDFIELSIDPAPENGHAPVESFRLARAAEFGGLEVRDLRPTMRFIQEVHTGRPTRSPEDSSPGPGSSEPSSTDESGLVEVVRPS